MDRVLSREEKKTLLGLLNLPPEFWGDFGRMQQAYKQQSLLLHPDKGGSHEAMQTLNSLWSKFKTEVFNLRMNLQGTGFQASNPRTSGSSPSKTSHSPFPDDYWSFSYGSKYFREEWNEFFRKWDPEYKSPPHETTESGQPDLYCYEEVLSSPSPPESPPRKRRRNPAVAEMDESISPASPKTPENPSQPRDEGVQRGSGGRGGGGVYGDGEPHRGSVSGGPSRCTSTPAAPNGPFPQFAQSQNTTMASDSSGFAEGSDGSYFTKEPSSETGDTEGCSQSSFHTTPPKKVRENPAPTDFPGCLNSYLSHAIYSNKTFSAFIIYSTKEKCKELYDKIQKFKPEFKCIVHYEEGGMLFFMSMGKHRVSAIKNHCSKFCSVSFLLCNAVTKPVELYNQLTTAPFRLVLENKPGIYQFEFTDENDENKTVDWNVLAEFALENDLEDPILIMGYYLDFGKDVGNCKKCNAQENRLKVHWKNHRKHAENAELFLQSRNQKTICQQAADTVIAHRRLKLLESTRAQILRERLEIQLNKIKEFSEEEILLHMAAVAWYNQLLENFPEELMNILKLLTENIPKRRNILLRGPVNSGKTSFAAALMNLLGGKSLNVNCPPDKLPFELGVAQDQFVVCFEDVKGQIALNKQLQPGQGVSNLDNLRDYLDGSVTVNLEKKHSNKRSQIFPPCICTMNDYFLPNTVWARFYKVLDFKRKDFLASSIDKNVWMQKARCLQSGATLCMSLLYNFSSTRFDDEIQPLIQEVKAIIDSACTYTQFCDISCNVCEGEDPLKDIIEECE
ncbi:large T antigen [Mastomys natalensis polyomavirus 3]|uniref:Large T antigen n=1 Tax=Mastomys natalensis polyomavirus 3 TaxID=2662314 RepID=A0A5P9NRD9_9POLY|nr:large T antigen [Mastomys natalensis polyomavirus 3]QFU78312.1 large T antigen [Mastomys natalensis polyomavirus 3]